jgi:4-carboxymuconolactone decarboxylase
MPHMRVSPPKPTVRASRVPTGLARSSGWVGIRYGLRTDYDQDANPNRDLETRMDKERFEKGLKTRREVLGAEYVDNAIANADAFNMPMQELVTQYCWGEVWNRPGLDRRTRSMLNLAMISALNRPHELKLHVRGAINNGLTKEEIQEVFLQVAIYCGVPAAIDSFRVARETFKEMGI